jgi:hypothetical protein
MDTVTRVAMTDGTDREIVKYLATVLDAVAHVPEPIAYSPALWERWLPDTLPSSVRVLPQELGGAIGVSDLRSMAAEASNAHGQQRLFLAALMWGLGKKNARMMPGLVEALMCDPLPKALRDTVRMIRAGHPATAYEQWVAAGIPGLGPPFFTKWFYAVGLHGVPAGSLTPLVMDGNVWKSLGTLGWSSEATTGRKYSSRPSAGYAAYLAACQRWSEWLRAEGVDGCTPHDIEHWLFTWNGGPKR